MKKGNVLTLTTPGIFQKVKRGTFELLKGKLMPVMLCKLTVPIANSTGGAVALSAAQRKTLLSLFILTLTHGRNGHRKPYNAISLDKMRQLGRFAVGQDVAGWDNTSTGLARSLPNGQTTAVEFWSLIPTGMLHQLRGGRRVWTGVGRSQASTIEIDMKYSSAAVDTGLAISGNVVAEYVPLTQSVKGDRASYFAEYIEVEEKDKVAKLPPGLPLLITELSAAHAASSLSSFELKIDEELIHDNVSAGDVLVELEGVNPELTAEASITDEVTVLYAVTPGQEWQDLPTGAPRFEQLKKDLSSVTLGYYYVPIVETNKVQEDIATFANLRNKPLRAATVAAIEGLNYPDRLAFAEPFRLLDQDDIEFEKVAGYYATPGSDAVAESIPPTALARARNLYNQHLGEGEAKSADAIVKQLTRAAPGGVQNARGLGKGLSGTGIQMRGLLLKAK
ncbi:hypothetical protein [Archangium violaceum]|uniref:Uncharacterized protein n=1 Tax=Archangium violaceum Cb vi76 TaxID=1406225 RepID=A0A084SE13_9BACT|nr:hypothetical protein [Archangium violaceum]KFA86698.1 hypothetical protein Q664_52760 [Archangium violaceum Cb vi76]